MTILLKQLIEKKETITEEQNDVCMKIVISDLDKLYNNEVELINGIYSDEIFVFGSIDSLT